MGKLIAFALLCLTTNFVVAQEVPVADAEFKNRVGLAYNYDVFVGSNFDAWHFASAIYERHEARVTWIGRLNYANRFGSVNANQLEIEAYPLIGKKGYMYTGIGYSPDVLFPTWRAGAEYFHNLPKAWEASLGFRYLQFQSPQWVPTATIGKYLGNYYISGRIFVALDKQAYTSTLLLLRKYTTDKFNFFNFMLGTGYSPDDFSRIDSGLEIAPSLFSLNFSAEYQHLIKQNWLVRGGLRFNREEFLPDQIRNRIGFNLQITKMF